MRMSSDARRVIKALHACGMETYRTIDVERIVWERVVQAFITQCKKWAKAPKDSEKVKDFKWYKPFAKMIPKRKDLVCDWNLDIERVCYLLMDTDGPDFSRADMLSLPEVAEYDDVEISAAISKIPFNEWGVKYLLQVLGSFDISEVVSSPCDVTVDKRVIDGCDADDNVRRFEDIITSWRK
jgi:hypothetical protein